MRRLTDRLRPPYQPPLLHWALALIAGAALSVTGADAWTITLAAAASTILALASATRADIIGRRRLPLIMLATAPLMLGIGFWRADATALRTDGLAATGFSGQTVQLVGRIVDEPQFRGTGTRLVLHAESIVLASEQRDVDERVQLFIPDALPLELGQRIQVEVTLTPITGAASDAREYLEWLERRGIAASGLVHAGSTRVLTEPNLGWPQNWAALVRRALNRSLRDALPPPLSGIAQGMITGRRDAIDSDLRSDLNDTSLSHLIVISGSNLTLLTTIVMAASAWLLGRRPAAALAIVAALAYGTLIGPDPPVQRAMWMAVVFAAAHLFGRGSSALYAVAATAALMIALEPPILLDLSFQLTLAGTLGIVLLAPALAQDFLSGQRGATGALRDASLITMIASLTTLPLVALHFERAALIGIPANLIVAPLFSWMLLGSAATALLGLVWESAAVALAWPLSWLPLRWLVLTAERAADLPGAGESIRGFGHLHLLIVYSAVLLAAWRPHRERIRRWYRQPRTNRAPEPRLGLVPLPNLRAMLPALVIAGAASAAAAGLWLTAASDGDNRLYVHFLDVGQGDAALIVTPERRTVLIDTGEQPDAAVAALRKHMPSDARRIDLLVITHPQADHGEALWSIVEHYDISSALVSAYMAETAFGRRVLKLLNSRDVSIETAYPGQQIVVPGEIDLKLDILWPPTVDLSEAYRGDANATSIVLRARFGDAAFLFTGDINAAQELDLVRRPCPGLSLPCDLRADVLKVPHQGSRFSSTTLFLDAVGPTLAAISASADNPHGHPHEEVLESLAEIGASALLTTERGDISVSSDGRSISVSTER